MDLITVLTLIVIVFSLIYFYYSVSFSFWKKNGIPGPTPVMFFGNNLDNLEKPITNVFKRRQEKFGSVYGIYEGSKPQLVVSDPSLLKKIMIQDFSHFMNRPTSGFDHPLEQKMFFLWKGNEWRKARAACTPAFTSSKIKAMTPMIKESVEVMMKYLDIKLKESEDQRIETMTFFESYALYNIGKTMFGIVMDTYDENNVDPVIKKALYYLTPSRWKSFVSMVLPKWIKTAMKFTVYNKEGLNAAYEMTMGIIEERKKNKVHQHQNDFLSIMLRNREEANHKKEGSEDSSHMTMTFSDDELVANCLLFIMAGTDPLISAATAFNLAAHLDVQERVYQEIVNVIQEKYDKEITPESLNEMPLLDAVVQESLRLYPTGAYTARQVSEPYDLETPSGHKVDLPVDTIVYIPTFVIHRDEANFPDANQFKPERFLPENKHLIDPITFHPFGHGPRNCIGSKIALLNSKMALANIIFKYQIQTVEKDVQTLDISGTVEANLIVGEIFLKFIPR